MNNSTDPYSPPFPEWKLCLLLLSQAYHFLNLTPALFGGGSFPEHMASFSSPSDAGILHNSAHSHVFNQLCTTDTYFHVCTEATAPQSLWIESGEQSPLPLLLSGLHFTSASLNTAVFQLWNLKPTHSLN